MSKPRHWWYFNVCRIIGAYPQIRQRISELESQSITASANGIPSGSVAGRPVENVALRAVSSREYDDYIAIARTIDDVKQWSDGEEVMQIVKFWHWDRLKNFRQIAFRLHMSEKTARNKNRRFVYLAAQYLNYR